MPLTMMVITENHRDCRVGGEFRESIPLHSCCDANEHRLSDSADAVWFPQPPPEAFFELGKSGKKT